MAAIVEAQAAEINTLREEIEDPVRRGTPADRALRGRAAAALDRPNQTGATRRAARRRWPGADVILIKLLTTAERARDGGSERASLERPELVSIRHRRRRAGHLRVPEQVRQRVHRRRRRGRRSPERPSSPSSTLLAPPRARLEVPEGVPRGFGGGRRHLQRGRRRRRQRGRRLERAQRAALLRHLRSPVGQRASSGPRLVARRGRRGAAPRRRRLEAFSRRESSPRATAPASVAGPNRSAKSSAETVGGDAGVWWHGIRRRAGCRVRDGGSDGSRRAEHRLRRLAGSAARTRTAGLLAAWKPGGSALGLSSAPNASAPSPSSAGAERIGGAPARAEARGGVGGGAFERPNEPHRTRSRRPPPRWRGGETTTASSRRRLDRERRHISPSHPLPLRNALLGSPPGGARIIRTGTARRTARTPSVNGEAVVTQAAPNAPRAEASGTSIASFSATAGGAGASASGGFGSAAGTGGGASAARDAEIRGEATPSLAEPFVPTPSARAPHAEPRPAARRRRPPRAPSPRRTTRERRRTGCPNRPRRARAHDPPRAGGRPGRPPSPSPSPLVPASKRSRVGERARQDGIDRLEERLGAALSATRSSPNAPGDTRSTTKDGARTGVVGDRRGGRLVEALAAVDRPAEGEAGRGRGRGAETGCSGVRAPPHSLQSHRRLFPLQKWSVRLARPTQPRFPAFAVEMPLSPRPRARCRAGTRRTPRKTPAPPAQATP